MTVLKCQGMYLISVALGYCHPN